MIVRVFYVAPHSVRWPCRFVMDAIDKLLIPCVTYVYIRTVLLDCRPVLLQNVSRDLPLMHPRLPAAFTCRLKQGQVERPSIGSRFRRLKGKGRPGCNSGILVLACNPCLR
jgi:hypothetical protein